MRVIVLLLCLCFCFVVPSETQGQISYPPAPKYDKDGKVIPNPSSPVTDDVKKPAKLPGSSADSPAVPPPVSPRDNPAVPPPVSPPDNPAVRPPASPPDVSAPKNRDTSPGSQRQGKLDSTELPADPQQAIGVLFLTVIELGTKVEQAEKRAEKAEADAAKAQESFNRLESRLAGLQWGMIGIGALVLVMLFSLLLRQTSRR